MSSVRAQTLALAADGLPTAGFVFEGLSTDAKAAGDITFEAMLILCARDGVYVEPCRRPLDCQSTGTLFFLLMYRDGGRRVVSEDELCAIAGVSL